MIKNTKQFQLLVYSDATEDTEFIDNVNGLDIEAVAESMM
ncbi:hypothetical protein SAMN02910382_01476 [Butyrivibrio sp. TB]|nr:hypothetical protein SAMN02910382_01476 [Butyrivibrio sp. TB]